MPRPEVAIINEQLELVEVEERAPRDTGFFRSSKKGRGGKMKHQRGERETAAAIIIEAS